MLACPVCGKTPKTYEWPGTEDEYSAVCPYCGTDLEYGMTFEEDPAAIWNASVQNWYLRHNEFGTCPYCKGKLDSTNTSCVRGPHGYQVQCMLCGENGPAAAKIKTAIMRWINMQKTADKA